MHEQQLTVLSHASRQSQQNCIWGAKHLKNVLIADIIQNSQKITDFMESCTSLFHGKCHSHDIISYIGPTYYWNYGRSVALDLVFTVFKFSLAFSTKCKFGPIMPNLIFGLHSQ